VEPIELAWDDDAWDSYQGTASTNQTLHHMLTSTLTRLASHPGDGVLRARRMQRPPLFVIPVSAGGEDWVIMWNEADDGGAQVWYVGPSPF